MSNFFLSKNFAKPGEIVNIQWSCAWSGSIFMSTDEKVSIVDTTWTASIVNIVWIWETKIYETTFNCTNGTEGIVLTATEDGNPFFMSKDDYVVFTNYEGIFVFFLLMTVFIFRFVKKT